jgi:CheY-like chemotaxis protein
MAAAMSVDALALHVLIADDNVDAAESLAMLLRLENFQLHTTADGATAYEVAQRLRPQVAVLDIGMPGLDGYALAQRLRGEPWGRSMLLIALTGWGQHADQQRAMRAGFDRHYTKPVDPDVLIDTIKTWHREKSVAR